RHLTGSAGYGIRRARAVPAKGQPGGDRNASASEDRAQSCPPCRFHQERGGAAACGRQAEGHAEARGSARHRHQRRRPAAVRGIPAVSAPAPPSEAPATLPENAEHVYYSVPDYPTYSGICECGTTFGPRTTSEAIHRDYL